MTNAPTKPAPCPFCFNPMEEREKDWLCPHHEDGGCQFHCSHECVKADLVKRGKTKEAKEYDSIVWMA